MPSSFDFSHAPFDCLSPNERRLVTDTVDIAYYPKGTVILNPDMPATHVHVVIKGHVQHVEAGEVVSVYGPDDFFGARAAMAGRTSSVLTALDEVITYLLPQATLRDLIAGNSRFSALLFADMSRRLSAVAEGNKSREFLSLMMVQVRDAFVRKPFFVDGGTDLVSLCAQLAERGLTTALEFLMSAEIAKTFLLQNLESVVPLAATFALRAMMSLMLHWEMEGGHRSGRKKEETPAGEAEKKE